MSGTTRGICILTGSRATVGKLEAGERDAFPASDFGWKKTGEKSGSGGRGGIAQVLDLTRIPDSHLYSLV